MGDRGNIFVPNVAIQDGAKFTFAGVYLYTHWKGTELPRILKAALVRGKPRWRDESYLTRIIFDDMVGAEHGELTGFGISARITDNEHVVIRVDTKDQAISYHLPDTETDTSSRGLQRWSFEEYIDFHAHELPIAYRVSL